MSLDKYLKVSRLIKRRTVANEACDAGRVLVNDKPAKASGQCEGRRHDRDTVRHQIREGGGAERGQETVKKDDATELYRYLVE